MWNNLKTFQILKHVLKSIGEIGFYNWYITLSYLQLLWYHKSVEYHYFIFREYNGLHLNNSDSSSKKVPSKHFPRNILLNYHCSNWGDKCNFSFAFNITWELWNLCAMIHSIRILSANHPRYAMNSTIWTSLSIYSRITGCIWLT